jgi:type IX secretion system PorP/SprF family membrane protein
MYNTYGVHPAYAGMENTLVATGTIRQQWAGLKGSPSSQQINANLPLNAINSGIGINLENDKVGVEQNIAASLTYVYKIRIGNEATLSIGANAGILQKSISGADIKTPGGIYTNNTTLHNDLILNENNTSAQAPLFDASVFLQRKNIKIGFTAKNLLDNSLNYTINSTKIRLIKNYLFTFASDFKLSSNFLLKPSLLVRTDVKEFQTQVSLLAEWKQKFSFGGSYRGYSKNSFDALSIIGGVQLSEKITLIYAYDVSLSSLKNVNTGSHELLLRYNLGKTIGQGIPEKIIYNPRYY